MQLWQKLYSTVWLAFFSCVLIPGWMGSIAGWPVHALLGLAMLIMTWTNARRLDALPVPSRLKSIGKTAKGFAVFQIVGGLALGAVVHLVPNLTIASYLLRGTHVVVALAILATSSSLATGYDMWEEKEFGELPAKKNVENRQQNI
jgi:uncharacterized iron-regulated membrane protein